MINSTSFLIESILNKCYTMQKSRSAEHVKVFGAFLFSKKERMMPMLEFISNNWHILTVLFSVISYLFFQVMAMRKGIRALLRADLIRLYNKYHDDLEYCPLYVKQSLEDEYRQYHALKGNGVGTNMYEALMALPTEPSHKEE